MFDPLNWLNGKLSTFCLIQHSTENKTAIKSRPAHPGYIGIRVNVGSVGTVPNYTIIVGMSVFHRKNKI